MRSVHRRRILVGRALQRRRPGALLRGVRPPEPASLTARTRARCCRRSSRTSAGASRASRWPAASSTFFKGGWRGTARGSLVHEAALFERGPLRDLDGGPHRRQPLPRLRHRHPAGSGAADLRRAGPARPARRRAALSTCTATDRASRSTWSTGRANNLTGRPLPGYCENRALLRERPARDLGRVQRHLRRRGLGLLVLDAYRPARASRALVRWAQRSGRAELVGTYIARRSRHNTGTAVDLTLVRTSDGRRLEMGSGYDDLSPRAHTVNARGRALPQPPDPQAGDGALRVRRLLARVVALRAPRAGEQLPRRADWLCRSANRRTASLRSAANVA